MGATKEYFGTDGVRGRANVHPMTPELALKLGRAAAYHFRNGGRHHTIVVGKDTRLSGYMFETALASGIASVGVDVMLVGPLPTPGIAFITQGMRADAGIVISASHNSFHDNGIKFFDHQGFKLPDKVELEIEDLMKSDNLDNFRPEADGIGKAIRLNDATGRYVEYLKRTIPKGISLEGVKVVIDCANGAAYRAAPATFHELGAHVIELATNPDGININSGCGSLHPELMCKKVRETGADLGIALDGDADRLIMCDENGEIVNGDCIMAINAAHLKEEKRLKKDTIVATVMSNIGLDAAMKSVGVRVIKSGVGDRYVVHELKKGGFQLGGEQSGHIIFLDHNTTGDGTLAALQTISVLIKKNIPLSKAKKIFTAFPQVLSNVKVKRKEDFSTVPKLNDCIERIRKELSDQGRVLVRYSGTENLARVMVEGQDYEKIKIYAADIAEQIQVNLGQ
jgi:phosphoglucosamine mutase